MNTPIDPAAVVAAFIDSVSPFDPDPDAAPVAVLGVRTALGDGVFPVSDHVIRAMCKALVSYRDPEDRGSCVACGSRLLDENLHCRECGHLHGILGEVIARHAARVAADEAAASAPGEQR